MFQVILHDGSWGHPNDEVEAHMNWSCWGGKLLLAKEQHEHRWAVRAGHREDINRIMWI